jgi:hypothetical protein
MAGFFLIAKAKCRNDNKKMLQIHQKRKTVLLIAGCIPANSDYRCKKPVNKFVCCYSNS